MKAGRVVIFFLWIILVNQGFGQGGGSVFQPGDYRDGIYDKENSVKRRFIPYTFLREADAQWTKRTWRIIDLREKINQPLYYPTDYSTSRISLIQVLQKALLSGDILAFNSTDEEFLNPMTMGEIRKKFIHCDSFNNSDVDKDGNPIDTKVWRCDSGSSVWRMLPVIR